MIRACLLAALLLFVGAAPAGTAPAELEFDQRVGASLPLRLALRNESGEEVRFGAYFGRVPVAVVLGYFDCPNVCSTLLDGVLEGLAHAGLPASAYRVVVVSIDGRDDAAAARRKAAAYQPVLAGTDAHFLTGDGEVTASLAHSAGFPYVWDSEHGQYAHPAGFLVATPEGRVARYFLGVRFERGELRRALLDAANGRTGSLADRLLMLCSHYDPQTGRYSVAATTVAGACSLLVLAILGAWLALRRRTVR